MAKRKELSDAPEAPPEQKYLWWVEMHCIGPTKWRFDDVCDRMRNKNLTLIQAIDEHVLEVP